MTHGTYYFFFFLITFSHFIILNSLKWPVQPGVTTVQLTTLLRGLVYSETVWNAFLFVCLLSTYSMCLALGVYWWTTDTNCYCETKCGESLPAMHETRVRSLGWEEPLEKQMAIHSNILSWRILWTQDRGSLEVVHEVLRVWHDWVTKSHRKA